MINISTTKAYVVLLDKDAIDIFPASNLSYEMTYNGPFCFKIESYEIEKRFHRSPLYVSITEKEIAELFINQDETLEEMK